MQKPNKFESHGYFVADIKESVAGKLVFNRTVTCGMLGKNKAISITKFKKGE